jgi:4-hydroxy-3-polyprenylbenzoate decarboxylase
MEFPAADRVYPDLRAFLEYLESRKALVRVKAEVDPHLEITEILNRLLAKGGPAVLFENVRGSSVPLVANVYGTLDRVTQGLGTDEAGLTEIGKFLAYLQHPELPGGMMEAMKKLPFFTQVLNLVPKTVRSGPCQDVVLTGDDVDLYRFPILKVWPKDSGSLITWPLIITRPPDEGPVNVAVYRLRVIGKDRVIVGWLKQRGGRRHYEAWRALKKTMPIAAAIGCEPTTTIAAVTPIPERLGEFHFAGLLRRKSVELVKCKTIDMEVPATAEIVLEGEIDPEEVAPEGFHGDHTGHYHPGETLPVIRIKSITHRQNPIYHTTINGRPPREDAMIGLALVRIFLPVLRNHFPEVVDFHLPMEAISYRMAILSIKKEYPGHAKRIMMGLWGFLKQFLYVRYIIVVDPDVDVRSWDDVMWALSTRVDPVRDTTLIDRTPFDYLDFASPKKELGSRMGIDATIKLPGEVDVPFEEKIEMDPEIIAGVKRRWAEYGFEAD